MDLAIGVSTLNSGISNIDRLIASVPKEVKIIVCHQLDDSESYFWERDYENVFYFRVCDKGLSKSRNFVLDKANEIGVDYVLISDDDVVYSQRGMKELIHHLETNKVKNYWLQSIDEFGTKRKRYPKIRTNVKNRDIFKVASIELCISVKDVTDNNVRFDTRFGLGSTFKACEEPIFLNDCIASNIGLEFVPISVAIHPIESSGSLIYRNYDLLSDRAAAFHRMYGFSKGLFISYLFLFKKYPKCSFDIGFFSLCKVVFRKFNSL
ncbi:glycosyltransferase [Vibrio astriarenae]